jgi:hypothetical protein
VASDQPRQKRFDATVEARVARGPERRFRVLPINRDGNLIWVDPAGYALAYSELPTEWREEDAVALEFTLDPEAREVFGEPYI